MDSELADLAEAILGVGRELRMRISTDVVQLTAQEAHVMRHIDHHPGVTPSDVARATGLQRSNLSTALRALERRGFVERRIDPRDARGVNLYPTERAADNLTRLRRQWASQMARALGGDLRDAAAATALLKRIEAGLAADRLG
ncbi:MarR family transcriptional regulator [Mycobacterium sp. CVI_P3]|uniref:MarR family transcriptional regulator n=1 Tax=Mycobacterium pinniadriaticum TaxID=2994102 RepID=A0ABT3SEY3_9MYCO|nr:MarR family transcriptional regulator [Mycobacterium pinniadriaticum]MCX2931008.1 MarR family transcriptional regulator [Mycobacterium pinniadriaticum]MCX2937432.1 MarR family transcriptional regulator [Mycobacterium pinniadriaticum]